MKEIRQLVIYLSIFVLFSENATAQQHQWEVFSGALISDLWDVPKTSLYQENPPLPTYNFGLSYLINEDRNYSFRAGVSYMSYGKYLNKDKFFDLDTTLVLPNGTSIEFPATITTYSKNYFMELPLTTEYKWQKGRFTPFIRLDIVPQIYLTRKYVQESDRTSFNFSSNEKLSNIRNYNLALGTGLGTYYKLNQKMSLVVNIFTRVQILSNQGLTSKYYIYGVGTNLGLAFDIH
jgi:Outer membrane protein beta-barrel domain